MKRREFLKRTIGTVAAAVLPVGGLLGETPTRKPSQGNEGEWVLVVEGKSIPLGPVRSWQLSTNEPAGRIVNLAESPVDTLSITLHGITIDGRRVESDQGSELDIEWLHINTND